MTLYLTDDTAPAEVKRAADHRHIHAFKLYPAGATTNSAFGVTRLDKVYPVLAEMERYGVPLLVHGEVVSAEVDVFDREAVFVDSLLTPLAARFPELRLVLEHITTEQGIDFVQAHGDNVAGTITAHHLLINRTDLFQGGMRPHLYCLPIAKREKHRQALLRAATSGPGCFFLGTDSAPHPRHAKESACGCAGIYTAHAGIELYAEAFESNQSLDKLEAFASLNGPKFYGLAPNATSITLERAFTPVAASLPFGEHELVPFRAGEAVSWRLAAG